MTPQELIQNYLNLYAETRIAAKSAMPDADDETIRAATDSAIAFVRQSYPHFPLIEPLAANPTQAPVEATTESQLDTAAMETLVNQLDTPAIHPPTLITASVQKPFKSKTKLAAPKKRDENANRTRLESIRALTGHTWANIKDLARQLDFPLNSASYSDRQLQLLRNSMYVDWAFAQEVFNHGNHALNSYSKLFTDEPDINPIDDTMVWTAWSSKIMDKVSQKYPDKANEALPMAS